MTRSSDGGEGNETEGRQATGISGAKNWGRKVKTQAKLQCKQKRPCNEQKINKPKSARQRSTVNQIRYF